MFPKWKILRYTKSVAPIDHHTANHVLFRINTVSDSIAKKKIIPGKKYPPLIGQSETLSGSTKKIIPPKRLQFIKVTSSNPYPSFFVSVSFLTVQ